MYNIAITTLRGRGVACLPRMIAHTRAHILPHTRAQSLSRADRRVIWLTFW